MSDRRLGRAMQTNGGTMNALTIAAIGEAATGLALLIVPSLAGSCCLASTGRRRHTGARVGGIALIALGIACWPGPPLLGMLT